MLKNGCVYCSKPRPVRDVSMFKSGQHISIQNGMLYEHHAIIKKVNSLNETREAELTLIHYSDAPETDGTGKKHLKIRRSTRKINLDGDKKGERDIVHIIEYKVSSKTPEEIVKEAERVLEDKNDEFKDYNFLFCNCEHFATWCVCGKSECLQTNKILTLCRGIYNGLTRNAAKLAKILLGVVNKIPKISNIILEKSKGIIEGLGKNGKYLKAAGWITAGLALIPPLVMVLYNIVKYLLGVMCGSCLGAKVCDNVLSGVMSVVIGIVLGVCSGPLAGPILFVVCVGLQFVFEPARKWLLNQLVNIM